MNQKWSVRALRNEVKKIKGLTGNVKVATGSTEATDSAKISADFQNTAKLLKRLSTQGNIPQDLEAMEKDQIIVLRDKALQVRKSLETLEAKYSAIIEIIESHLIVVNQGDCPDVGTVGVMGQIDTPDAYSTI